MTFAILFVAYLIAVAGAASIVVGARLPLRASLVTVAVLLGWLAYATLLGATGIVGRYDQVPPGMALLVVPVVLTLLALTLTFPGALLSRRIPLRLLLGFQFFRVGVELSLHHLWTIGLAPKLMTLGGGNVEILIAVTAPIAAWLSSRGWTGRRLAWAWNLAGLVSLANVITRATLSAPGPLHLIRAETPDFAILTYPFTFIPGFFAPLALALHILALRAFRAGGDAAIPFGSSPRASTTPQPSN